MTDRGADRIGDFAAAARGARKPFRRELWWTFPSPSGTRKANLPMYSSTVRFIKTIEEMYRDGLTAVIKILQFTPTSVF